MCITSIIFENFLRMAQMTTCVCRRAIINQILHHFVLLLLFYLGTRIVYVRAFLPTVLVSINRV